MTQSNCQVPETTSSSFSPSIQGFLPHLGDIYVSPDRFDLTSHLTSTALDVDASAQLRHTDTSFTIKGGNLLGDLNVLQTVPRHQIFPFRCCLQHLPLGCTQGNGKWQL